MSEPRAVEALYDRWAESYDAGPNRTRDLAGSVLRRAGLELAGRAVLELGCGTGGNTGWLAERAASVLAVDFSEGMMSLARARLREHPRDGTDRPGDDVVRRVRFLRHDIRQPLPLRDATLDFVVIALVLEHVERLAPVLAECARVLRPGGELFVCEYHPYRQLRGGQARFSAGAQGEEVRIPAFLHLAEEFVNAAVAAGLRIVHLGEWWDESAEPGAGAGAGALPRVLSLRALRPLWPEADRGEP